MSFIRHQEVSALKFFQPTCLCPGLLRVLKKSSLGKPFGKASLDNTAYRLGRFISMRDRSSCPGEGWYRYPSEVWPDEALKRVFPGPSRREVETGEGKLYFALDKEH